MLADGTSSAICSRMMRISSRSLSSAATRWTSSRIAERTRRRAAASRSAVRTASESVSPSARTTSSAATEAPRAADLQRLAGELVDDVQQLQDPPVGGLVELEVKRPHVIGALCSQALGRHGRVAQALALAPAHRHAQALLAPQALHALAVDRPALLAQLGVCATVSPARAIL